MDGHRAHAGSRDPGRCIRFPLQRFGAPFTGVARPRLVDRLEQGVAGRLTLISAPAGWGKSTLVAEWAATTSMPVAWVTLDPTITTPDRFLRHLVAALDQALPLRFDDVATMVRTANPAVADLAADAFLETLADLPAPVVVVLDDAHHLVTPEVKHLLHRLVDEGPGTLRLVLTVRGDVRLPLARLRSAGNVTVVRDPDLAFSVDEATALLAAVPALGERGVRQLVERTEGWAAGLRLAALSLDRSANPQAFLDRLRGTHRDIADYFCEEVLDCLDPGLVQFLVETSILDSLTAPLAAAVAGGQGDAFAQAVAGGVFLIPQDDERTWYRYHALFRDLLRLRFESLSPERRRTLHLRASAWHEEHGLIHDSMRQALAAGELDRIAALIERHADTLMYESGDTAFLIDVFEELPRDLVAARPALLRVQAWVLTIAGRIEQADRLLQRGCDVCGDAINPHLLAVEARIAAYRGDHRATVSFGRQALDHLDVLTDGRLIADVTLSMGFAERAMGRIDKAAETFREAARLGRQHRNGQAARWGVRYLAVSRIVQGRLGEAQAIVDEDLERLAATGTDGGSHRGALLVTRAEILIERNQLEAARAALDPAFGLIQRDGDAKMLMNAYAARALLAVAEGEFEIAREKARRAEELHPPGISRTWMTLVALARHDLATAERWARTTGFELADEPESSRGELEQLLYARTMAALGVPGSIDLLARHIRAAVGEGRLGHAIALRVALASAFVTAGESAAAELALCDALRDAAREGHVQVFLNEGVAIRSLLRDILRTRDVLDDACRAHALDILARFPGAAAVTDGGIAVPGLTEPLTGRQLEILQLLADGRSNREIAGALYIAEGTVKAHMHQLFGKLVARNRTEAVANARDLSLIP